MPQETVSAEVITDYWNGRSTTYYNGVVGELGDDRRNLWESALEALAFAHLESIKADGRTPRVLDLGCGPGFFEVLFAERGYDVDGVDASESMLERARENIAAHGLEGKAALHCGDVASLPFPDGSFDLAISRNLTWLLRFPEQTYAEWLRVLTPGGKMIVFDANWYRYLDDPDIAEARRIEQTENTLEGWDDSTKATPAEEEYCEQVAMKLPMTHLLRPDWDIQALENLGASSVRADVDIWREIWTENEHTFYASSPMFLVEAVK